MEQWKAEDLEFVEEDLKFVEEDLEFVEKEFFENMLFTVEIKNMLDPLECNSDHRRIR